MATTLRVEACRRGKSVQIYWGFRLGGDLAGEICGRYGGPVSGETEKVLRKVELFFLDEVGYVPFSQTGLNYCLL